MKRVKTFVNSKRTSLQFAVRILDTEVDDFIEREKAEIISVQDNYCDGNFISRVLVYESARD